MADSSIEVDITLVDDTLDGEPINDDLIDAINDISLELNNISSALIDSLGISSNDISFDSADFCGDRTCSGLNVECNHATGFCECPPGYGGIDCQFKHKCDDEPGDYCTNNGACSSNGLYCLCNYPHWGYKCNLISCNSC